jgi:hypothetical protein
LCSIVQNNELTIDNFIIKILKDHEFGYIRNNNSVFQINGSSYLVYKGRNENQTKENKNIILCFETLVIVTTF